MHVQIHLIQLRSTPVVWKNVAMRFERLFFSYIFLCWTLYPFSIPIILVREYNLSNLKMFRISGFLHKIYQIIAFHFIRGFEKIFAYVFLYWTLNPSVLQVFVQESSFKHQIYFSCQGLLKSRFRKPIHSSHTLHLKNI